MAEPKVVTMSGRTARLLSGGQQAIPETAGLGSVSVRFEPFGTQLNVLPIVLGNGRIQLDVNPIVSNIDASVGTAIAGTIVPGRNQQEVQTTVIVETGQTLVIGGLIQNTVQGETEKVPILGDLPILGAAFSRKRFGEIESELVVLITPRLVDPMSCEQLPKYYPGQETRSPDDYELFLEGILEAPRGQRELCPGGKFRAAYLNGPTASIYPCGKFERGCGHGNGDYGCGVNGCKDGNCTQPAANGTATADGWTNNNIKTFVAPVPVDANSNVPRNNTSSASGVSPSADEGLKSSPKGQMNSAVDEGAAQGGKTFRLPDAPDAGSSGDGK
jgi:hypothetical protein